MELKMIKQIKKVARKAINSVSKIRLQVYEMKLGKNKGYCNICEQETIFIVYDPWLRDNYKCKRCQTIPRNRAIVNALNKFAPDWRKLQVHESSPGGELSKLLKNNCSGYSSSHYYPDIPRGEYKGVHRSEDLSALTFDKNLFDVFITSDVFEHVL